MARITSRPASPSGTSLPAQTGNGGKFLQTDGTATSWATAGTSIASPRRLSGNATLVKGDLALCNAGPGSIVLQPPASPANGDPLWIKKVDSSTNTVTFNAPTEGDSNLVLTGPLAAVALVWDTALWRIVGVVGAVTGGTADPTVPGIPTAVTAAPGNAQAFVSFTASTGATTYTATSSPGGFTATGSGTALTVTGLTNGTAYTFTVHATNAAGNSAESSASASVTPIPGCSDSFTRADSGTSLGTADTGQVWQPVIGTWGIASNQARPVSSTAQAIAVVDSARADGIVQVTLVTAGSDPGFCWRVIDANNFFVYTANTGFIYRVTAGTFTKISATATATSGAVMSVTLSGSSHTVAIGGSNVTYTDTQGQTATKHGIRASSDTTSRFDNFSVV